MNLKPSRKILSIGECMVEFSRAEPGPEEGGGADGLRLWRQGFAGDTLNVTWAMRACLDPGVFCVDYFTALGDDEFSAGMFRLFEQSGIGTSSIRSLAGASCGLYTISVDEQGERSFSYWRSASAARHLADDIGHLNATLAAFELVYVSGISLAILPPDRREAFISALGEPEKRSFKLAFDSNMRPGLWESKGALRGVTERVASISDYVLPTHDDEQNAFGDASALETLERYKSLGCREIVVKDGKRPSRYFAAGKQGEVAVAQPVQPVDTTGAGDSFSGSYLAARLEGEDVETAIRRAQRVAAQVIGVKGALAPMDDIRAAYRAAG